MKRGLFPLFFVLIILTSFGVYGKICSSPDQTILKLDNFKNSHASSWYHYSIVYGDINGNGGVDLNDLTMMRTYSQKTNSTPLTEWQMLVSDIYLDKIEREITRDDLKVLGRHLSYMAGSQSSPIDSYTLLPEYKGNKVYPVYGDINGDGVVGVPDINQIVGLILNPSSYTDLQNILADLNFDGRVSIGDVFLINSIAQGQMMALPDLSGDPNYDSISIYDQVICYDEIFGSRYEGEHPQECNGNNKVLNIDSESSFNSHAYFPIDGDVNKDGLVNILQDEALVGQYILGLVNFDVFQIFSAKGDDDRISVDDINRIQVIANNNELVTKGFPILEEGDDDFVPVYEENICYGDLDCVVDKSAGAACADSERKFVVGLDSALNAHLSSVYQSGDLKVCCKSSGGLPTDKAYWAKLDTTEIKLVRVNSAKIGDSLFMVVPKSLVGNSFFEGDCVSVERCPIFKIVEKDAELGTHDFVRDVRGDYIGSVQSDPLYGSAVGIWVTFLKEITDSGTVDYDNFRFGVDFGSLKVESDDLKIDTTIVPCDPAVEDCFPEPPIGMTPECGDYFLFDSSDGEKAVVPVKITSFGGKLTIYNSAGQMIVEKDVNGPIFEWNFEPSSHGDYSLVFVSESDPDKVIREKTVISNIMVVDKSKTQDYLAACIDKPEDASNIPGNELVELDASTTRGIRYNPSDPEPLEFINKESIKFEWVFSDDEEGKKVEKEYPSWKFTRYFLKAGRNWAKLYASYPPSP